MTDAEERERALAALQLMASPDSQPSLTADEVELILDKNIRAISWSANSAVTEGQRIRPTDANGRWYMVIDGGTTGDTEPSWPQPPSYLDQFGSTSGVVTEGDITYEDCGPAKSSTYDVAQAAWDCWNSKMAKASQYISTPGIDMASIFKRCQEMRDSFDQALI